MNIEFTNGATVNRVWKDGEGELLAAFQYDAHATQFAEALTKDETQPRDVSFAVLNHHKGTVKLYKQPEPSPIGWSPMITCHLRHCLPRPSASTTSVPESTKPDSGGIIPN